VLALAIAVGLGGQTIAKEALEQRFRRRKVEQNEMSHI
jgi:hypothetical protein